MKNRIFKMILLLILGIFILPNFVSAAEVTAHISGSDSYEMLPANFKIPQYAGRYTYQSKNQIGDTIANGDSVAKYRNGVLQSTAMISILYDIDTGDWVYCLQASDELKDGYLYNGFAGDDLVNSNKLSETQRKRIHLISYFGFAYVDSSHNHMARIWYSVAQKMIWETAGYEIKWLYDVYDSTSVISKYTAEEAEIESLINQYYNSLNASFGKRHYTMNVGDTLRLTEVHNDLSGYQITSQSDGLNALIDGNDLVIQPSIVGSDFELSLAKEYKYFEAAPIIYHREDSQDVFKVGYLDPASIKLAIDVYGGKIEIHKLDFDTNTSVGQGEGVLKGAKYGIYDNDDALITTLTTDENGYAISDFLPKLGIYKIKELSSSKGYLLDENVYNVTVNSSNTFSVNVKEKVVKNFISILKQCDYVDGNTTFLNAEEGITFQIYNKNNHLYKEITTDKNGYATIELPYGVYKLHQKNTLTGFEKIYDFYITVDENSESEQYYNILNNKLAAYLQVFKTDEETGETIKLAHTKFKILNTDTNQYVTQYVSGRVLDTFETDEEGKFISYLKIESGNYKLVELESPKGYLINTEGLRFSINEDSHYNYTTYGAFVTVRFSDKPIKGKIEIIKKGELPKVFNNKLEYDSVPLENVKFEIYAAEDILSSDNNRLYYEKDELVVTLTTDENGYAISDLLYLGKYYIKEVETNSSYVLNDSISYIELVEKDNITSIVYSKYNNLNKIKKGSLEISKLDISTSNPLPNTKIEVYTITDELIYSGITNSDGKIIINELPIGKYYILEKEAPEGYLINESKMYFEIKENGEVIKSTMFNEKEIIEVPDTLLNEFDYKSYIAITFILSGLILVFYEAIKKDKNNNI